MLNFSTLDLPNGYTIRKGYVEPLMLAAAGKLNFLLVGEVADTKTLAMQGLLPAITPDNTNDETDSSDHIWNIAGLGGARSNNRNAVPVRFPHSTATIEGMFGGGINITPGEISLAHNGILLLDEAEEFRSSVIQMLRIPVDIHQITLSRAGRSVVYPANFQLGMTILPCPCGNYGSPNKICLCSARSIDLYWKKVSDPLLDRVAIKVFRVDNTKVKLTPAKVEKLREKVSTAIELQRANGKYIKDMTAEELAGVSMTATAKEEIERIKVVKDHLGELQKNTVANLLRTALTVAYTNNRTKITLADVNTAKKYTTSVNIPY